MASRFDDIEVLRETYRALEQADPGEKYYVPRPGPDVVSIMERHILIREKESIQFLTGPPGCGKSTELLRLGKRLKDAGFYVRNIAGTPSEPEMLIQILRVLDSASAYVGELKIANSMGLPYLSPEAVSERLEEFLRLTLYLYERFLRTHRVAILVDDTLGFPRFPFVHLVYVLPKSATLPGFPHPPVQQIAVPSPWLNDFIRNPAKDSVDFYTSIVRRRTGEGFVEESSLQDLVRFCAGNISQALYFLKAALLNAHSFPLTSRDIERAIQSARDSAPERNSQDLDILRTVYRQRQLPSGPSERIQNLVEQGDIRCFGEQEPWYDVHPGLWPLIAKSAPTKQSVPSVVYFRSLALQDVRCFRGPHLVSLTTNGQAYSRWNVILGDNATGKTTILRAIAAWVDGTHSELSGSIDAELSPQSMNGRVSPLCIGYGAGRGTGKTSLSGPELPPCATLLDESIPIPDPQEWLLRIDYLAQTDAAVKRKFEAVTQALISLLPEVTELQVEKKSESNITVQAKTPDGWIPLHSLSFGYQTALAWLVDLCRRLFDHYPNSPDPLAEPVVVLIDEIDLHLHPKWQRRLLDLLDKTFKQAQFIVTAHSPLVVQAAPNANLILLRREGDGVVVENDLDYIRKWRVDQILASELFESQPIYSPEVQADLDERIQLASKPDRTPADQQRIDELDEKLNQLPTAARPDDQRAMDLIRRGAKLWEKSA